MFSGIRSLFCGSFKSTGNGLKEIRSVICRNSNELLNWEVFAYLSNATYLKGVSLNDCLNTKYAMIKRDIKEMETQTILKIYSLHKLA